jgi:hypothetical protein
VSKILVDQNQIIDYEGALGTQTGDCSVDILITTNGDNGFHVVFGITLLGQSIAGTDSYSDGLECLPSIATRIMKQAKRFKAEVRLVEWSEDVTRANAIYEHAKQQMRRAEKGLAEVMTPLFEDAFDKRDRDRVKELLEQYPDMVAKSFVLDRFRQANYFS